MDETRSSGAGDTSQGEIQQNLTQSTITMPSTLRQVSSFYLFLLITVCLPNCLSARNNPVGEMEVKDKINNSNSQWHSFSKFTHAGPGSSISGLSELKRYFHRFGYLVPKPGVNFTDEFDAEFESAVATYQRRLGLEITRQLDSDTVTSLVSPRCGMKDNSPSSMGTTLFHATRHYTFFEGMPRWERPNPVRLTYAFSPEHMTNQLSFDDIRGAVARAFATWAQVIPVEFEETSIYQTADVRIGFYTGDHGDGDPFDGVLGMLAHSFMPEDGRMHFDDAETWAVDFGIEQARKAMDLESVATHEIGHVLGLGHTPVKEAVMYPVLKPRTTKVDLAPDDVEGIQTLYGSNPNFTFNPFSQKTESSSSLAGGQWDRISIELVATLLVLVLALMGLS